VTLTLSRKGRGKNSAAKRFTLWRSGRG
jgi:hypothetical protein